MTTSDAILITGATGFIGSHLLIELLQRTQADIYCPVREHPRRSPSERVHKAMRESLHVRGWSADLLDAWKGRVHTVVADMSQPRFAMGEGDLECLAAAGIRSIWHSASCLRYTDAERDEIDATNIVGTQVLLQLADTFGVATFNHISTAYVAGIRTGLLPTTLPTEPDDRAAYHNAYEHSKARSEVMVAEACRAAGIQYRIFRPSAIIGDSHTFHANSDMGLYGMVRRLSLFKRRTEPRMPGYLAEKPLLLHGRGHIPLNLLPIDHCMEQIFAVCAAADGDGVYHIVNPRPPTLGETTGVLGACLELRSLDATWDESEMTLVDKAFRKSYEFYASYMVAEQVFDHDNVACHLAPDYAERARLGASDLERYILDYIEQLAGVDEHNTYFQPFSLNALTRKHTTTFDGMPLDYFTTDTSKPAMVLINAFGMDLEFWGPTVNYFRDHFRLVTWYLRGLPAEEYDASVDVSLGAHAEDLHSILQAEGIGRAVIVGWCAGPKIALEYFRRYPDSVSALVLVAGKYDSDVNPDPEASPYSKLFSELNAGIVRNPKLAEMVVQSIMHARASDGTTAAGAANTILSACSPALEYAPYASAPFANAANLVNYSRMSRAYGDHDVYDMLERIDVPTLVIAAEDDAIAHPTSSRRVAEHISDCELTVLRGASHFCVVENPGVFIHSVSRYLKHRQLM
jgi:thioester reductase-like protein/pimeloyl-ACP methyl ester carboxylesterase